MTQGTFNPEATPEKEPFHRVEWNGSVAEIYNADLMLNVPAHELCVYDRSDFQTPIERVQIFIEKVDVEGDPATDLTAWIKLDRSRNDYLKSASMYKPALLRAFYSSAYGDSARFVPQNKKDQDLTIEPLREDLYRIFHQDGGKIVIAINGSNKRIEVVNSVMNSKEGKFVIPPPIDGTLEPTAILEAFFKAFMRTMDFTAGLADTQPGHMRLNRTYVIGREVSEVRSDSQSPGNIGRSALMGAQSSKLGKQQEVGNRSNLAEDLPDFEIVDSKLSLDDIGGLEHVKRALQDIATSFKYPEIMEKWGAKRPQGVLLYGEPGTGKTMLAEVLANEIGAEMWAIQSSDIYDRWLGNSEQHIKDIFRRAREHKGRLIIFFDEFDSIVGITEDPMAGEITYNAVAGIFKQEMNDLTKENPNVLVLAATNNLDSINPSLLRPGRFDHKVYVPMPDEAARRQIISNIVAKSMLQREADDFKIFDPLDVPTLAHATDGMSGADITEIFRRLSLSRAMQEARTNETQPPITQEEIEQEVRGFRTTG